MPLTHGPRRILETALRDLRLAARSLRRFPLAVAIAVLSLAAGIGSTTATLTARNALFVNPPPLYTDPDDLSRVGMSTRAQRFERVRPAELATWLEAPFPDVSVAAADATRMVEVRAGSRLATVPVQRVTTGLFALLGVQPILGRTFSVAGDARTSAEPSSVVISYRAWRELFDQRQDVLGQVVTIDNQALVVIGVMPPQFRFRSMVAGVWRPLDPRTLPLQEGLDVVARSRQGRTSVAGRLERALAGRVQQLESGDEPRRVTVMAVRGTPLGEQIAPYVLWLLGAAVFLTLLIACTNVAVLMIAQWTTRDRELAVRAALGASRGRLIGSLIAESVLIAGVAGSLGVCATFALRGMIVRGTGSALPIDLTIDAAVLLQSTLVTLAAGLLAGLGPAVYATRRAHAVPGQGFGASERVRQRWRHALVVFEIAVTVALLVVTGAFVSAYRRTLDYDPGFDVSRLLVASVRHESGAPIDAILARVRTLPGVDAVSVSTSSSAVSDGPSQPVSTERASTGMTAERVGVGPDFFATVRLPLRAGRAFGTHDTKDHTPVTIVNDGLARQLWPGRDPIGRRLFIAGVSHEVVGMVAGARSAPLQPPRPTFYVPVLQDTRALREIHVVVRTTGERRARRRSHRRSASRFERCQVRMYGACLPCGRSSRSPGARSLRGRFRSCRSSPLA